MKPTVLVSLASVSLCSLLSLHAEENLPVHGSASATFSSSGNYDYLGATKDTLALNMVDLTLNSTHRFDSGLRMGAQLYGYKLASYDEVTLDFANIDYSFHESFGLRIGRNKLPHGLYNDSQDLDSIRVFAMLPLSFYPRTLRSIEASFDGVSFYGNLSLGKGGSIDYQAFGGAKETVKGENNPLLKGLSSSIIGFDNWKFSQGVWGASVFWNLPVEGLKLGTSYQYIHSSDLNGSLLPTSGLSANALAVPTLVDTYLGAGAWDKSGKFAGTKAGVKGLEIAFRTLSAEYSTGKWTLAAEYRLTDLIHGVTTVPALALLGQSTTQIYNVNAEYYYGMVSYQATDKLGLGVYYAHGTEGRNKPGALRNGNEDSNRDYCAAACYNLTKWWLVKAEYHFLDGFEIMNLSGDSRPNPSLNPNWHYIVLKTTVTF